MIAVDTSALVAVYTQEPGHELLTERLFSGQTVAIAATTYAEFAMLTRIGSRRMQWLDANLALPNFILDDFVSAIGGIARAAMERYGKGSGHPAQLNFGDCLSYGFATYRDLPLLFVGDDFRHTDVTPAI
jgi:ribonuclease VapC